MVNEAVSLGSSSILSDIYSMGTVSHTVTFRHLCGRRGLLLFHLLEGSRFYESLNFWFGLHACGIWMSISKELYKQIP